MAAAQEGRVDGMTTGEEVNEKTDSSQTPNGTPAGPTQDEQSAQGEKGTHKDGPEGGFDALRIPRAPPGVVDHTLKITFHRATHLVMGDAHAFSSDPYILAQLNTNLPQRHKEDPHLRFRSPTVRKSVDPEWNEDWIVANVPSSGFTLKVRVYDEDPADQDDLLGKCHVHVPSISDGWAGLDDQAYQLSLRRSSKRAVLIRSLAVCFGTARHITGDLYVSIQNLGRTGDDEQNCKAYTVGPCRWFRHHSPLLGRIANVKEPSKDDSQDRPASGEKQKNIEQYNFQANQMQLQGPVPAELYHRFVEFKPWVKRMFTAGGLQGIVLSKALHHQHTRVYTFGRSTIHGYFPQGPCKEMTQQFLDLVHYDRGGRIFTYVITLDALFRFTETGKEFGVDMLSKHTMHSDVSIYIAFSGEFFIRRLKHRHRPPPPQATEETSQSHPEAHKPNDTHPPNDIDTISADDDPPKDPARYELVIDNDSGTYRPNASLLPLLASFLAHSLPGLHIQTLDCQADSEKMSHMKAEQRARKKAEGEHIIYTQGDESDSLSSSDDERLDAVQEDWRRQEDADVAAREREEREEGEEAPAKVAVRDWKRMQAAKRQKGKRVIGNRDREGEEPMGALGSPT